MSNTWNKLILKVFTVYMHIKGLNKVKDSILGENKAFINFSIKKYIHYIKLKFYTKNKIYT